MIKLIRNFFLLIILGSSAAMSAAPVDQFSPTGYWQQVSDEFQQPQSIMYISENNGVYEGKVVAGFLINQKPPRELCDNCPNTFQGKRILGMTIMWGYTQKGNYWGNGRILDPNQGKIYRSTLSLGNAGQELYVRGYLGIPLFGRSQTWHRLSDAQALELAKTAYQSIIAETIESQKAATVSQDQ